MATNFDNLKTKVAMTALGGVLGQGLPPRGFEQSSTAVGISATSQWSPSVGVIGSETRIAHEALSGVRTLNSGCYLTAIVEGANHVFASTREKFEALAQSWEDYNLGRSVIDYHDFAMQQIIGMGADVVPFLIERLAAGQSDWVYALKSITGQEADTPDMLGDEDRVVSAWIEWGRRDGDKRRQARSY